MGEGRAFPMRPAILASSLFAPIGIHAMTEPSTLRPVRAPAKGQFAIEFEPALLRTAMLHYRDHLAEGGGVFHVDIPPHPDSHEAKDWNWRSSSEISLFPPLTFRHTFQSPEDGATSDYIVTERSTFSPPPDDSAGTWQEHPHDPGHDPLTLNWLEAAIALLAPQRLIHGWTPQWDDATPTTTAGRPGTRVPLAITLPWSDPRSYGDDLVPDWMHLFTETAEIVIDDEHGVILEWNGLVDGEVFHRNAFTAIDFNAPLTARDFDPDALGLTKPRI